ncbi:hypothetical protein LCGC14_2564840 [marine sediment metagenome]|uniref:Uncharacterized protein n=1 Tax=marine sediment metagenome TaxID=412755 RepID=A0A0F8WUB1_9ZZZZ
MSDVVLYVLIALIMFFNGIVLGYSIGKKDGNRNE